MVKLKLIYSVGANNLGETDRDRGRNDFEECWNFTGFGVKRMWLNTKIQISVGNGSMSGQK